jgi:polyphosphate kinase 2 (PPK2 family)
MTVWNRGFADICAYEDYLAHDWIAIRKFFLNVSRKGRRKGLLEGPTGRTRTGSSTPTTSTSWSSLDDYMHAMKRWAATPSTPESP